MDLSNLNLVPVAVQVLAPFALVLGLGIAMDLWGSTRRARRLAASPESIAAGKRIRS